MSEKILNPATGRMVLKSGKIGQQILAIKKAIKRVSKVSKKTTTKRTSSSKRVSASKVARKKTVRKAPAESATLYPPGTIKYGANGVDLFQIRTTSAGIQRWVKL